ncbi:MAG: protein kinase, partial [Caldilineaceae bacterium]|nr:protein kinase [Caldilineaceae bacterium]
VAKFAIVDEVKLAAKMRMNSAATDRAQIERFIQEHTDLGTWMQGNRQLLTLRCRANQQAIANEAQLWRDLQHPGHPNLVQLYSVNEYENGADARYFGESDLPGNPHYVLVEYLRGGSLRQLVDENKGLTVERALDMLIILADILQYFHSKGLAHLDIKPQNVVFRYDPRGKENLRSAEPILLDLGIAGRIGSQGGDSLSKHWAEKSRALRKNRNGRLIVHSGMDVYSLALVLKYMVTGEYPPSISETVPESKHHATIPSFRLKFEKKVAPEVHQQVATYLTSLIERCLVDLPERRPKAQDVHQAAVQLQQLLQSRQQQIVRPRRTIWTGAVIAAMMVVIVAIFAFAGIGDGGAGATATPVGNSSANGVQPALAETGTATPNAVAAMVTPATPALQPVGAQTVLTATATATVAPTATVAATEPPTATATNAPAVEPTIPTLIPTATVRPTNTRPTETPLPTATPIPTRTATNTPVPQSAAPADVLRYANASNLRRSDGAMCNSTWRGRITLRWDVDSRFRLPPGYGYDVAIWTPDKAEDPLGQPGLGVETTATSMVIDADVAIAQGRNPNLTYQIGIMLVKMPTATQKYERIRLMGPTNNCRFKFQ